MAQKASSKRVTVPEIRDRKLSADGGTPITALTAYDYTLARLIDAGKNIDLILVGDSVGSVVQGHGTTLPVTLDEMIYHSKCVVRGVSHAVVVGDLPFLSYQCSIPQAIESAGRLLKEGGVSAVKLEGGVQMAETIERLTQVDIPVMGHVGLTPQSYHRMGGHRVQGRGSSEESAAAIRSEQKVLQDALAVEAAGAFSIVLEGVPGELAAEITAQLTIPTIGIGAGAGCDGQILVTHDMLGLNQEFTPRFVKRFAELGDQVQHAISEYVSEVQAGSFPAEEHTFGVTKGRRGSLNGVAVSNGVVKEPRLFVDAETAQKH